jgi:riboflavin synthase
MFTGIIQAVGKIAAIQQQGGDARLRLDTGTLPMAGVQTGDSIAVNGVCLTAVELVTNGFVADVSGETLTCTTLGSFSVGQRVNLEKALTLGTPLGGHLVSGHVDGVGEILEHKQDARSVRFRIRLPAALSRYVAAKGSVCLDGASLTVNSVAGEEFEINLVPHTLAVTTLSDWRADQRVNVEVDLVARHLERLMLKATPDSAPTSISREFLATHGFLK